MNIRAKLLEEFGKRIPKSANVSISSDKLIIGKVKDSRGNPIILGDSRVRLVFVDFEPDANWTHPCAYVFFYCDGDAVSWWEEEWPPHPSIHMRPA